MAARTYGVALFFIFSKAHRYATRWQTKLEESLSAEAYTCLLAVIAALAECLPLIKPPPPIT